MDRTTIGSLLRSTQAYCSELCEKETLEYGIAYFSPRFAALPEANQFREVLIEDPAKIPEAFEQAEAWFRERKLYCHRWAPAEGRAVPELADFLTRHGFRRRQYVSMSLVRWVDQKTPEHVRILPARAMREAYRETFTHADVPEPSTIRKLLAEAALERLDDPQLDMVVALWDKRPAGHSGLYQVGDIARVMNLNVLPEFSGRGIEQALLGHVLTIAKRLAMRNVLTQIDETDRGGRTVLGESGFTDDGEIVEFDRDPPGHLGVGP